MSSVELYKHLLDNCSESLRKYTSNFPTHESQFHFSEFNEITFEKMYLQLKRILPRQQLFTQIPELEKVCKGCWAFYLSPRNKSVKHLDIRYGKVFENALRNFLISLGFNCVRSDELGFKKNYPDLAFLMPSGSPTAFFEVKYLTAPFVKVYEKVPGRECYEGSTTLDVDDKFKRQREIVENEIHVPVYYVYWIDYPCIKGVFYMPAKEVFAYVDRTVLEWSRKEREGDFISVNGKKMKVGHTEKVYLPLLTMMNLEKLVKSLKAVSQDF